MEQDRLDYVLAIIEEKNLTRAADRLYISQSSLSKYISRLENELGAKLFIRNTTPIELTEAGEIYVRRMTKIKLDQENMMREMRRADSRGAGRPCYHLGIGFARGNDLSASIIRFFAKEFPDWNLEIHNAMKQVFLDQVRKNVMDLAIDAFETDDPQLAFFPVCEEKVYFIFPRKWQPFCNLNRDEATIENPYKISQKYIAGKPMFLSSNSGGFNSLLFQSSGVIESMKNNRTVFIGNAAVAAYLASEGMGGALWLDCQKSEQPSKEITSISGNNEQLKRRLAFCCTDDGSTLSRKVGVLVNREQDSEKRVISQKLTEMLMEVMGDHK